MKLSIVIVTWNSARDIEACIDSINYGSEFELIVVDNASTDSTLDLLSQRHHLKLIANKTNAGYAHANNQGIAAATGEYVLLLNPDARTDLGALDKLSGVLDTHPDAGAAAPRLVNPDGTTQYSIRTFPTAASALWETTGLARLFPHSRVFGRWKMRYFDYGRDAPVEQPMASCLMIRRAALEQLKGMDERFPIYFNDVDLSKRMAEAGWKTFYVADAGAVHECGGSTLQVRTRMIRESHRSLFRYLAKHDRSGIFWLKAIVLLPLLEASALVRVIAHHLRPGSRLSR
jgi:GT2 family glycosyltransferase